MKKILMVAILSIGFFSMSQAQSLDYYVSNADPVDSWDWAIDDAGPWPAIYEFGIAPNTMRTGSIPFLFSFPIEWKAQDTNGCQISNQTAGGPTPVLTALSTCPGTVAFWQVGTIIPFVQYYIKIQLN